PPVRLLRPTRLALAAPTRPQGPTHPHRPPIPTRPYCPPIPTRPYRPPARALTRRYLLQPPTLIRPHLAPLTPPPLHPAQLASLTCSLPTTTTRLCAICSA